MPTILIRGASADLVRRVRAYADPRGLSERDAAEQILRAHLDQLERRAAGGATTAERRTPAERTAIARRAVAAREARRLRICRQCEGEYCQGQSDAHSPEYWCSRDCEQGGT